MWCHMGLFQKTDAWMTFPTWLACEHGWCYLVDMDFHCPKFPKLGSEYGSVQGSDLNIYIYVYKIYKYIYIIRRLYIK
jgi:hypothetical protein